MDARSDQFELAIVLYEIATGARLFHRGTDYLTMQTVLQARVAPPSATEPGFPKGLEEILMRALSRAAGDRFPSCRDFGESLESWATVSGFAHAPPRVGDWMKDVFADTIRRDQLLLSVDENATCTIPVATTGESAGSTTSSVTAAHGAPQSTAAPLFLELYGDSAPARTRTARSPALPSPEEDLPLELERAPPEQERAAAPLSRLVGAPAPALAASIAAVTLDDAWPASPRALGATAGGSRCSSPTRASTVDSSCPTG